MKKGKKNNFQITKAQPPSLTPKLDFRLKKFSRCPKVNLSPTQNTELELKIETIQSKLIEQKNHLIHQIKVGLKRLNSFPDKLKKQILANLKKAEMPLLIKIYAQVNVALAKEKMLIESIVNLKK